MLNNKSFQTHWLAIPIKFKPAQENRMEKQRKEQGRIKD